MTMYDLAQKQHPLADEILNLLGMNVPGFKDYTRYRNVYPMENGTFALFTRLGDTETYESRISMIRAHPHWRGDHNWEFDTSYRTFIFHMPQIVKDVVAAAGVLSKTSPEQDFERMLKSMS